MIRPPPTKGSDAQQRDAMRGKPVGVIHCGGNIDTDQIVTVLKGGVPQV